jgi:hypothetical protein
LFEKNFLTVCDGKIVGDKTVLPPVFKKKKKAGRTKKKRYRKRSVAFVGVGASSYSLSKKVRCNCCGELGHNVRTCASRGKKRGLDDKERVDDGKEADESTLTREPFEHLNELSLL